MTATRMFGAPAAAALVLVLAACGGSNGGGGNATPEAGPIDKLWEDAYGEYDEEEANAENMEVEELVAECMNTEGFEYIPVDYSTMGGAMVMPADDDGEELQWGTLEFAKEYGYGQTTNPWGDPVDEPVDPGQEWVDPNQEYLDSMTETEMTAYQTALWGVQPDFTEDEDWENWNPTWEEQGCYGYAQHEVYGDQMWGGDEEENEWADLEAEMQTMWESLESDPRVAEAVSDWASCMADAGYPGMVTIYDGENLISEKVSAVWEDFDPYADLDENATEEDYRAAEAAVQERLSEITPEEIETAVADYTCRDDAGYQDTYNEVNIDLQQQFYDAHKAELEAYVEAMSS